LLTNRAFLMACATVATLGVSTASSTPADARPCHTKDSTPRQERSCLVRSAIGAVMTEATKQAAMAKQAAMEKQAAAMQAAMAKKAAAKQAAMAQEEASNAAAAKSMAPTGNPTTKAATPAARAVSPCLTKDYLDNGAVMFRDNCTGEWAQR
jgi:hypothetical protein